MGKRAFILLGLIVFLAFTVRVFNLSSVAPSPFLDEVSNGYNAYSILKTGSDEYGRHMPLLLQAYNDFRPALFVYLIAPFVHLFGLTVFAIRLPAVLLGTLTTLSLFFLVKEILRSKKVTLKDTSITLIPLFASFLYAITPWSIYSSRIADEINMSLSFFVFGLTAFLYSLNRWEQKIGKRVFFLSILLFVISFYSYHGIKLFLPFFLVSLGVLYGRTFWQQKKIVIMGLILGVILVLPLYFTLRAPENAVRLGAVNTISTDKTLIETSAKRLLHDQQEGDFLGKIFDNRRVLISLKFLTNTIRNFDPSWLFLSTEGKSYRVPDLGPLYLFQFPLLIAGFYFLSRTTLVGGKVKWILLLSILLSAIPAGLNSESPHLNRTNTMLPGLTVVSAFGLYQCIVLVSALKNKFSRKVSYAVIASVIVIFFVWFARTYFIALPYQQAKYYQFGAIQAFEYAKTIEGKYEKIVVSNANILLEGYMYYLFAVKYDPKTYQLSGGTRSAFFTDTHLIGKYDFRDPNMVPSEVLPSDIGKPILFITNPGEVSGQVRERYELSDIKTIFLPDGKPVIILSEGKIK